MSGKLETNFAGIVFKNPVVLASGTCGFGSIMKLLIWKNWEASVLKG